jgi:hypothetical protein
MWVGPNTSLVGALEEDGRVVVHAMMQPKSQAETEAVAMDMIAVLAPMLEMACPILGVVAEVPWE